uniref:Uncharacterized protein n=1 Tax=Arundo donax TaxID=35708 RepID=A0A0A9B5M0_ARUDO
MIEVQVCEYYCLVQYTEVHRAFMDRSQLLKGAPISA